MTDLIRAESSTESSTTPAERYQVHWADWSGPFDILLQVVDEKNLNLLDLDISILLDGYLEHLKNTPSIDIDEAGEFLLVGSTLAQIKSRLLLPKEEVPEEEEKDPREDLVRYLMEYQKFKQAAELLGERPLLGRDVFVKGAREHFEGAETEGSGNLFQLVKGFQKVLREVRAQTPMAMSREEVSVSQRLLEVFRIVKERGECEFRELLDGAMSKVFVIVTFLSLLELVRLKKMKVIVPEGSEQIYLRFLEGADESEILNSEFDETTDAEPTNVVDSAQENSSVEVV
jgi:segregation and condensation protein A